MSEIEDHLKACLTVWPDHLMTKFMVMNGRKYRHDLRSYAGARMEAKACYQNATLLMMREPSLTYVEGKVSVYGLPIDHAWCVDPQGLVIDPTLVVDADSSLDRIRGYFGIPFRRDYVHAAVLKNDVYGLLDGFYARKTLPKLVELGLEQGQAWLLRKRRKLAAAAMLAALVLLPHDLHAQQTTVYGPDGRVQSRTVTGSNGSQTVYGADGRVQGRTTTSPSSGVTTVYGSDGRVQGTIVPSGRR